MKKMTVEISQMTYEYLLQIKHVTKLEIEYLMDLLIDQQIWEMEMYRYMKQEHEGIYLTSVEMIKELIPKYEYIRSNTPKRN